MTNRNDKLIIRGARMHNLKNINLEIPHNQLTVITGVSGSGKSSLAFDTIFAEGQRQYVESLSPYMRQFLSQKKPAEVDEIIGLEKLHVIHVNDSKNDNGARKDRHANIGEGNIGFEILSNIVHHPLLKGKTMILETPYIDGVAPYKEEIEKLLNRKI